ncbi:hypothetical protein ABZ502_17300 [Streptomyces abikoensis]|uniref:hypothetical protein n=1 Tax=Streptomyces abikoensis TaxID=97398 RepID=UPI0033C471AD
MATIDDERLQQIRDDAEQLLRDRYNAGRDYLDPVRVMHAVRAAALGYDLGQDGAPPEVPAQDVLAALTQLAEARAALDTLELDLLQGAKQRGASLLEMAHHLGLRTRQSAETRFLRLQAASATNRARRAIPEQRRARARQRNADAWCRQNEERMRKVAARLLDVAGAWPHLARDPLASSCLEELTTVQDAPALAEPLNVLRLALAPYGMEPPAPTGDRAGDAVEARDALLALLEELIAVRAGVTD